jgi:hypothetical protein
MFRSIKKFKKLSKSRNNPRFWADNIIDSELLCESDEERKHFYQFIMNPKKYDADEVKNGNTLGDLEKEGLLVDEIEKYPVGFMTDVYTNGNETLLFVKNEQTREEGDDEKCSI